MRTIQSKADDEHRKQQNHIKIIVGAISLKKYPASEIIADMSEADAKKAKEVFPDVFGSPPDGKPEYQNLIEEACASILSAEQKRKIQFVVDGAGELSDEKLDGHKKRLIELSKELESAHRKASEAGKKASQDKSISGSDYNTMLEKEVTLEEDFEFIKESLAKLENV